MSEYWDHAQKQPDLLIALNYLRPSHDIILYRVILKAWNKVTIPLHQRAHNAQTIAEALVYNRTRTSKVLTKVNITPVAISELCGSKLVQTLLHDHLDTHPIVSPIENPKYTTTQRRLPCEHDRCTLYAAENLVRNAIIGRVLLCPVCQIFNHAAKHTHYIVRAVKSHPRLRAFLSGWAYILDTQTEITRTRALFIALL